MSKTILTLFLLQLIIALTVNVGSNRALQHIIVVPDEQPTIQAAINIASSGDTVYVKTRVYYENVIVNKSINLVGENRETTIIDGQWRGAVITITVSNVIVSGFTIRNSDSNPSVYIYNSDNCIFTRNLVVNNGRGVLVKQCSNVSLTYNCISSNELYGVRVDNSTNCKLTRNIIADTYGESNVRLVSANNTYFFENIVSNSTYSVRLISSHHNIFYRNNFLNKAQQTLISDSYDNMWHNTSLLEGNYWSNYKGQDLNGDGIGDTPYVIDASNADNFPLMRPWTPLLGDLNIDGKINLQDLAILAKAYGSTEADLQWNPLADIAQPYGKVSLADLVTIAYNYGKTSDELKTCEY
jgi:parallel beta-helix repeat protein